MKWGLGDSYDNVSVLSEKGRAYLDLTKPASTLGIAFGVILASFFYAEYTNTFIPLRDIIFVAVTAAAAHGASQAMNMVEDAEMDSNTEHKQNRPIPSGVISKEEGRTVAWFLILFALTRGYLFNKLFGVFITILVFMGVFYNLEPIRAKSRAFSIPWQAVSRGLMFFPTIWAAYGTPWGITPWTLGIFMFFYVLGFQNTADIIDKEVDKEYGIKTFVVMFGEKRTSMIASGCMLMMMATIFLGVEYAILESKFLYMLGIIPFCMMMLYYMTMYPNRVSNKTGNHPAWLYYYIGLVLAIAIPLVVEMAVGSCTAVAAGGMPCS